VYVYSSQLHVHLCRMCVTTLHYNRESFDVSLHGDDSNPFQVGFMCMCGCHSLFALNTLHIPSYVHIHTHTHTLIHTLTHTHVQSVVSCKDEIQCPAAALTITFEKSHTSSEELLFVGQNNGTVSIFNLDGVEGNHTRDSHLGTRVNVCTDSESKHLRNVKDVQVSPSDYLFVTSRVGPAYETLGGDQGVVETWSLQVWLAWLYVCMYVCVCMSVCVLCQSEIVCDSLPIFLFGNHGNYPFVVAHLPRPHIHTHTQTHTYTRIHIHIHTHTNTHTLPDGSQNQCFPHFRRNEHAL
jgi:hypothetical protein